MVFAPKDRRKVFYNEYENYVSIMGYFKGGGGEIRRNPGRKVVFAKTRWYNNEKSIVRGNCQSNGEGLL